jgi:MerR family transcriptional regulator, redox-sensitive transcriptional activator SoxR
MTSPIFSIGEVAHHAGLKTSAVRFYEQAGLLPKPARQAGQRRYAEDILDRLALLEYAKNSGFKLEEIRRLFNGTREGLPLSARWQKLATAKSPNWISRCGRSL